MVQTDAAAMLVQHSLDVGWCNQSPLASLSAKQGVVSELFEFAFEPFINRDVLVTVPAAPNISG